MDYDKPLIFEISPGKTGTTSLHEAMCILGYKACHGCPIPYQAEFMLGALGDKLDLPLFQDYDYVGNLVNFMFKRLERRFPNAKFIYLDRDADEWLNSVLYQLNKNKFQVTNTLSVSTLLRVMNNKCITTDDPQHLLDCYREHRNSVHNYFVSRPDKLLSTSIKHGWSPLCWFLGKPIPSQPFPRLNVSDSE